MSIAHRTSARRARNTRLRNDRTSRACTHDPEASGSRGLDGRIGRNVRHQHRPVDVLHARRHVSCRDALPRTTALLPRGTRFDGHRGRHQWRRRELQRPRVRLLDDVFLRGGTSRSLHLLPLPRHQPLRPGLFRIRTVQSGSFPVRMRFEADCVPDRHCLSGRLPERPRVLRGDVHAVPAAVCAGQLITAGSIAVGP